MPLEAETFNSHTAYDALNRPVALTTPDNSVIRPTYNEANLLERVEANLRGEQANGVAVWTPFVTKIDYDAKGQRERIDYGTRDGQGITTTYTYDPDTFRLIHIQTRRNAPGFDGTDRPGEVQNLHYTYDPVGNITHIRDDAQQMVFFRNHRVEPSADYTYDAIYRLIEATGREHLGQVGGQPNPPTAPDAFNGFHTRLGHPGDGNAMGTYIERYVYDAVGNILAMQHRGSNPAHPGWTRTYAYNEASQLEVGKVNNRLSSATVGATMEPYRYDGAAGLHGNMTRMPHLANHPDPVAPNLHWDYQDQLRQADLGGSGTAYYVYDASGQRVRKVCEKAPGLTEERIYLGGFEIFRRRNGAGTITLERETLHIMDDQRRIALVETRTQGGDPAPGQLIRYQLGNHLDSAGLELDDNAQLISYEEYTPYSSTSYQAVRSQTETPKRYRYTGKERDEESGFYYQDARYYMPWLGRWLSADPAGMEGGLNLYVALGNNPITRIDPTGTTDESYQPIAMRIRTSGTAHALGIEDSKVPTDLPFGDPHLLPETVDRGDPGFLMSIISPSFRHRLAIAGLARPLQEPMIFHPGTHRQQFERGIRRTTRNMTRAINRAGDQAVWYSERALDVVSGLSEAAEASALTRVVAKRISANPLVRKAAAGQTNKAVAVSTKRTSKTKKQELLPNVMTAKRDPLSNEEKILREGHETVRELLDTELGQLTDSPESREVLMDALVEAGVSISPTGSRGVGPSQGGFAPVRTGSSGGADLDMNRLGLRSLRNLIVDALEKGDNTQSLRKSLSDDFVRDAQQLRTLESRITESRRRHKPRHESW